MEKVVPISARFGVRFYLDRDGLFLRICIGCPVFVFSIYNRAIELIDTRRTVIGFGWIPIKMEQGSPMPIWEMVNIKHERKQEWQA